MENYTIYLRKSRADQEAEARGEGETLARHERTLVALAKQLNLNITEIYREIVSGETIAARPVMQKLLSEVEQGLWGGVLVMEVERLARGDTIDQGIMAQAFKYSNTKIITPMKTYDPNNEADEEYFEFSLFMSRREYKSINRRLQAGRMASVKEGKYLGSVRPFGYKIVKLENEKGNTLEIVPEEAETVKLMFSLYTKGELCADGSCKAVGIQSVARILNDRGFCNVNGSYWQKETVRRTLQNPVYVGNVRWGHKKEKKKMIDGKTIKTREIAKNESEYQICKGKHKAIVDNETFQAAQRLLVERRIAPVRRDRDVINPLMGLVFCGKCGKSMIYKKLTYRSNQTPYIYCQSPVCDSVSSPLHLVEKRVLDMLNQWLNEQRLTIKASGKKSDEKIAAIEEAIKKVESEIKKLTAQLSKVHDAFEQEIYNSEQFTERSRSIGERVERAKKELRKLEAGQKSEKCRGRGLVEVIPKVVLLMGEYDKLETPREKNEALKLILDKVVYTKDKSAKHKGVSLDDFELVLYPLISRA